MDGSESGLKIPKPAGEESVLISDPIPKPAGEESVLISDPIPKLAGEESVLISDPITKHHTGPYIRNSLTNLLDLLFRDAYACPGEARQPCWQLH